GRNCDGEAGREPRGGRGAFEGGARTAEAGARGSPGELAGQPATLAAIHPSTTPVQVQRGHDASVLPPICYVTVTITYCRAASLRAEREPVTDINSRGARAGCSHRE